MLKPACPQPFRPRVHRRHRNVQSVHYSVGPAQRSPLIIAGDAANAYAPLTPSHLRRSLRHTAEKQQGTLSRGQIKSFVAQERFCVVAPLAIGANLRITGF